MILITPSYQEVVKVAREHGIEAKVMGRVVHTPGIRIVGRGLHKETVSFAA